MSDNPAQTRIQEMVSAHPVMVFMKGTPDAPQCGFSNLVANVLKDHGGKFAAFDVLSDTEIRAGIKEFGDWPTIPQLYIKGELVGGSDIIRDMYTSGELQPLLDGAHE